MRKLKILAVALIIIFVIGIGAYGLYRLRKARYVKETVPVAISIDTVTESVSPVTKNTSKAQETSPTTASSLPANLNLAMTFYSQAPFGNWSEPWQNACEESSMLLVANEYFKHNWTREQFRDQILKIVAWETKMFGDYKENDANQMMKILEEYLGLKGVIHKNPTFADVQNILAKGHLIVFPLAGREIGNPYYTNGGPDYHVMVVKGYKEGEKIITEDVGTSHGENYVYSWETFMKANHDYAIPIDNGAKVMIEVLPPSQK